LPGWPRPSCDSSEDPDPDALTPGGPHPVPLGAAIGDSPALPPCRPHFTDTTAPPLAPHPRHLTRDLRSRTFALGPSPNRSKKSGVGINADHALNRAPAIAGHDTCRTCLQIQRQPQHDFTPRSQIFVSAPAKQPHGRQSIS